MSNHSSVAAIGAATPHRRNLFARLVAMLTVRAERRRLADLDDATLRDIGLSRDQAMREALRPMWDVPPRWRR
ncbi:DUF1127 domain-containing protein [Tabrizicola sp. J26]|uniref:DUF1127 domain-containing protein n=1 Tax=Alitabrizicola rongguiensis TaxID=2909234 RepID=UPI001F460424|nr:DUF1127 domain-containing protein [Tabrizicola rongguiensis]MCF1708759.1 DUF1127 domain-containing protein [Tabrizicola rongguiensis]